MNSIPRYDARAEIRTDLAAAIALARSGKTEQAIALLSHAAGCLASLPYAEILGADMKKAERLQMMLQKRHIIASENQVAARLTAMADISPSPKIIVYSCAADISPKTGQELERIYGKHGVHALILDLSQATRLDAGAAEILVAMQTQWRRRGCFFGIAGQHAHISVPAFSTVKEARDYINGGATGGTAE